MTESPNIGTKSDEELRELIEKGARARRIVRKRVDVL